MIKLMMENLVLNIEKPQWVMILEEDINKLRLILDILQGKNREVEGEYCFDGRNIETLSQRQLSYLRKREVINISDNSFLIQDFTVGKNLQMQLKFSGIYPTKGKKIIEKVLKLLDMAGIKDQITSELTLLQQLQVRIAKALVVEPKLICGVAPFTELKEEEIGIFVGWIRGLIDSGMIVVMVTTNLTDLEYGDEGIIIK